MLKRMTVKKISIATILLFICFLFVLFPKEDKVINLDGKEIIEYSSNSLEHEIFMVNKDNYVAKCNVKIEDNKDVTDKVRTLLEYLIIGGKKESEIPNGFRSIIPSGTEIKSIELKEGLLKIDFSKEILEIDANLEESMLEAIVYSLTSIKEVKGIVIYVEGELLTVLPKSKTNLPTILDRNIGINKVYNIDSIDNITKTTIYYLTKNNDNYYYVPVTNVDNSSNEKIEIIIDELSKGPNMDNLMSFLNINTKLLNYEIKEKQMILTFNEDILSSIEDKSILEEVINTINYSIDDNYDVNEVVFRVGEEEILKIVLKTLD